MLIRVGYDIAFRFLQPTAMIVLLYVHPSCASTIQTPERFEVEPSVAISEFVDSFGNRCGRLFVPSGCVVLHSDVTVEDSGQPDPQDGNTPQHNVEDFSAWFEAYLEGTWYTFDPRNNAPRIGRVLMARGRDAADAALTTTLGVNQLESFKVWTDEVCER
jgi:transglutaminase-like putative cysteine protease